MTTYTLRNGLQLALMKLESSLSSQTGLQRSPIVEFKHDEERMAARLVERLKLVPPIDVDALCGSLAELSYKAFPIDIDGLCLDLKVAGKRPKVWISKNLPTVRRRFTLAHEIGHIIIPWHTGTIVDDIDAPRSRERGRYRIMEAEANRFAAELLMPTAWGTNLAERSEHVADLMHSIHQIAQVSMPAAFLKAGKVGKTGFVGAEVRDGVVVRALRTTKTNSPIPESGASIDCITMPAALEPKILRSADASFHWWQMRDTLPDPGHMLEDWRQILDEILEIIPAEMRAKARASVNAFIGLAIGRVPKGSSVDLIYKLGMEAAQNRDGHWTRYIVSHPRFADYVLARARDRAQAETPKDDR